jgi:hypothetical protein
MTFPLWRYGGKGLPLAKIALPFVYFIASSKVHSALLDGFESGKMIGFVFSSAMVLRMDWSKIPRIVDSPMRMVGLTKSTTSGSVLSCWPLLSSREK